MPAANDPKAELNKFVDAVINCYKKYGDGFKERIIQLADEKYPERETLRKYIFTETAKIYHLEPADITDSNKRGQTNLARVSAIILMHKHLAMTQVEIAATFEVDKSLVSHRIRAYNENDESQKFISNKNFQKKIRILEEKVSAKKKQLNLN